MMKSFITFVSSAVEGSMLFFLGLFGFALIIWQAHRKLPL
jgi:hypothetical protein